MMSGRSATCGARRLALVTTSGGGFGGMETFTRQLCEWLLDDGWRITLALCAPDTPSHHSARNTPPLRSSLGRERDISPNIHPLLMGECGIAPDSTHPSLVRESFLAPTLAGFLSRAAHSRLTIDMVHWVNPADLSGDRRYTRAAIADRLRWFRRVRPDVAMFVQSSNTPIRASVLAARLAGIPVVTTQRTMPARLPDIPSRRHCLGLLPGLGLHRRRLIASACLTAHLARRVVYNSHAVRRLYESEYGYPRARGMVIPNAVNVPAATSIPLHLIASDRHSSASAATIGYVGRLGREKRLDILLQALAALPAGLRVTAEIHGDGPERESLTRLAAELGLSERVRFCGPTTCPHAVYPRFDVVVLCSPRESSSNMILEAMAAGRPVIVTRVGGMPELVEHGRAGICVEPLSVPELAAALQKLLCDPQERVRLAYAAREHARIYHDPARIRAQWTRLLREAAGERPAEPRTGSVAAPRPRRLALSVVELCP